MQQYNSVFSQRFFSYLAGDSWNYPHKSISGLINSGTRYDDPAILNLKKPI